MADDDIGLPLGSPDETELLLQWLGYLRGAVVRNADGLSDEEGHWRPGDKLLSVVGIINHLTLLEWRWIDGAFNGADVSRSEAEFAPGPELTLTAALRSYRERAAKTDSAVRSMSLRRASDPQGWAEGMDLRWVLLHLVNETARHAGHADATRELLDGTTGE